MEGDEELIIKNRKKITRWKWAGSVRKRKRKIQRFIKSWRDGPKIFGSETEIGNGNKGKRNFMREKEKEREGSSDKERES